MKLLISCLVLFNVTTAYSQILVDESWGSSSRIRSESPMYNNSMKAQKKIGIQTTLAGATGLAGLNLDINFTDKFAFSFGFGLSKGFQSFNAHIKKSFSGQSVVPYFVAGYSRWYSNNSDSEVNKTSPPILANKFLDSREKSTGIFSEHIIYPGLGLQYLINDGDMRGLGFFAEAIMLVDIDSFLAGGTGGIGTIYYF